MGHCDYPIGLDAIHFTMQGSAMMEREDYQEIRLKINRLKGQLAALLPGHAQQARADGLVSA